MELILPGPMEWKTSSLSIHTQTLGPGHIPMQLPSKRIMELENSIWVEDSKDYPDGGHAAGLNLEPRN